MRPLLLILFFVPLFVTAQKKDTIPKYLDGNFRFTTKNKAVYYGVAVRQEDGWFLYSLYPDNTPMIKAYFKDKDLLIKHGPYTTFYPKGKIAQHGFFADNRRNGEWKTWHPNGQLKDSGAYKDNQYTGEWVVWHDNGQVASRYHYKAANEMETGKKSQFATSFETYGIKEGAFSSWYPNGVQEATGLFRDDLMEGVWRWYHENGNPSTVEQYKDGKLNSMQCFDSTGKETGDFCSISKPAVLKYFGDPREYIRQNLIWPEEAVQKRIQGSVKVLIRVNKKGEVEALEVSGEQELLRKAVMELFDALEWYPAISHNRAVDWSDEIVVPFYFRN